MRLTLQKTAGFDEDIFFLRVRHGTTQLLLNRGSEGICLVDCARGESIADIPYPPGVEDFSPYAVLVAPHGAMAYLFGSNLEPFAIEVDLVAGRSRLIRLTPPGGIFTSVGWFEPDLNILDTNSQVWTLQADEIVRRTSQTQLSKRGEFLRETCRRYAVRKMDSTAAGVYVFGGSEGSATAGHIPLQGPPLFIPQRGDAHDLARHGDVLFICYENGLAGPGHQALIESIPGESFLAVEALNAGGPVLALLVDAKEGPEMPNRELRFFRIEP